MEGAALLLVDDDAAAQLPRRYAVSEPAQGGGTGLSVLVREGAGVGGGELCRARLLRTPIGGGGPQALRAAACLAMTGSRASRTLRFAMSLGGFHEPGLCPQRPQSQPARQAPTAYLRPRDAGRHRGRLPQNRRRTRPDAALPSEQPRV